MIHCSIGIWDLSSLAQPQIITVFANMIFLFIIDDHYDMYQFMIKAIEDNTYEERPELTAFQRVNYRLLSEIHRHSDEETFEYHRTYLLEYLYNSLFEVSLSKMSKINSDVYYRARTSWGGSGTICIPGFTAPQMKEWVYASKHSHLFSDLLTHMATFTALWNDMNSWKKELNEKGNLNVFSILDNEEDVYNYSLSRLKLMANQQLDYHNA
ncbi:hypothetical protein SAMD00019534_123150 [Acytostelium subglobosum LB1]|uniref:hypothetical protein n=1 Tax=Acytostelium subglobosum LB1 TaxID=1410327 RepID=UPI00064494E9|nr:hypothetical protein SAMD00019534_123150 [Acytostelium subglobosum LB1]GAM29139.1 hypothetical protein SAMD00019534_123150 [Acytostelium subglobosum LB1]|eukprot:XP_012747984.1 hypothetical protein SAMD00019534_123150 [Acytostelium subglobosum LB1]